MIVYNILSQIWYEILSGCKPLWVFEGNWCWKYSWVRLTWDAGRVHFFFLLWRYLKISKYHLGMFWNIVPDSLLKCSLEKRRGLLKKKCFNLKYNFCDASKCHKKMAIAVYLMQKWLQTTLVATIVNIVPYNISSMSLLSKLFNANMASHIKENYPLKISAKDSNSISIFFCALS